MGSNSVSQALTVLSVAVGGLGFAVAMAGIFRAAHWQLDPRTDRPARFLILAGASVMMAVPVLQFAATVWRAFE